MIKSIWPEGFNCHTVVVKNDRERMNEWTNEMKKKPKHSKQQVNTDNENRNGNHNRNMFHFQKWHFF